MRHDSGSWPNKDRKRLALVARMQPRQAPVMLIFLKLKMPNRLTA